MNRKVIQRLAESVAERVQTDELAERRGDVVDHRPSKSTAPMGRLWAASMAPGGSRAYITDAASTCLSRDARVAFVADLMSVGQYRTAMLRPLANTWSLSVHSVRGIASEASRWVREAIGDREQIRANCMAFLETIAHDALENGDRRSAVAAVRTVADIAGLIVTKTEVSGADGGPIQLQDLSKLSDAELEAAIVKAAARAVTSAGGPTDDASRAVIAAAARLEDSSEDDDGSSGAPAAPM